MGEDRRRARWMIGLGLIGLVAAAVLVLGPSLAAPLLSSWLSARAGAAVRVGWIAWNPFVGRIALHDVTLAAASGEAPVVTCEAVRVALAPRRWLGGERIVEELALEEPWVDLQRTASGDLNVAALVGPWFASAEAADRAPAGALRAGTANDRQIDIRVLRIAGASVRFRDETTTPTLETSLHIDDVRAEDLAFTLGGRTELTLRLTSRLEHHPLTIGLRYRAAAAGSELRAKLVTRKVALSRTLFYLPLGWQQVAGSLDVRLAYERRVRRDALTTHALGGRAALHDLALAEPWSSEHTLRAERARLPAVRVDFMRRHTDLGTIELDGFRLVLARDEEGLHVPLAGTMPTAADGAWKTTLTAVNLGRGEVVLRDVLPGAEPELRAAVRSGAVSPGAHRLSFRADTAFAAGTLGIDGESTAQATRVAFALDGLSLPEMADSLRLPLRFSSGRIDGTVVLRWTGGPANANGRLELTGAKSVPPNPTRDIEVLAWHALDVEFADSTLDPLQVRVVSATADWPYLMIHRSAAGVYPLTALVDRTALAPAAEMTPRPGTSPVPSALTIESGVIRDGRVEFYDTTFPVPFWTGLADMAASFEDLRVSPLTVGQFQLTGALDELSPATAEGTIDAGTTELRATAERVRLAPLNPYLEPALRYEITSGTARIRSTITLTGSELSAVNDLVLSRFAMTARDDEFFKRQLGVPLTVALALMKDGRGEINLHLPVHGDLATQEYRVGSVFLTALKEALVGAVRAPLTLLGSAFRREEAERFDLEPVPFAPGSAELAPDAAMRIAQVARLLTHHSSLLVVLLPEISLADTEHFRSAAILRALAQTLPEERTAVDATILQYLQAREAGPSPVTLSAEATAALQAREDATAPPLAELQRLAATRVGRVARELVDAHQISAERIRERTWNPAPPQPDAAPGVDLQLRGAE